MAGRDRDEQARDAPAPRAQRIMAAMAFTLIGLSAVAVVALLVLHAAGVPDTAFRSGGLVVLTLLPLPGLSIGLLLVIATFILVAARRARR